MGEVRSRRTSTSGQSFLARRRPSNGHSERATWQWEGRLEDELRKNPSPPPPPSSASSSSSSPSFFSPVCGLVLFPFYEQSKSNVMVRILQVEWRVQLLPETARHQLIPSEKMGGGGEQWKKQKLKKNPHPVPHPHAHLSAMEAMDVFGLHHLKGPTADALDANSAFFPLQCLILKLFLILS